MQTTPEVFKTTDYVKDGVCTVCERKMNLGVVGFDHAETCWVKHRSTCRYYETAFTSVWNLLVLIEADIVDVKALQQLRFEVAHLVFGYAQDPELLMKASIESLAMTMSGLRPEEV